MKAILTQKANSPRNLFIITDGIVLNLKDINNLVKCYCSNTRVFAYGMGEARDLVRAVANVANGQWEMVLDGENLEGKMKSHLKMTQDPALIDVINHHND